MKFVTHVAATTRRPHVGVVVDGDVLTDTSLNATLLELLRGTTPLEAAGASIIESCDLRVPLEEAVLEAPIATPPTFRDFMSFEGHVVNGNAKVGRTVDPAWYRHPTFYFSNPYSICGPTDAVRMSPGSKLFDFELEVGAVLGGGGRDLSPAEASGLVAGYVVLADWSARDLQAEEAGVGLGPVKAKDGATSLGPMLVTPDELEDVRSGQGHDLRMTARVNGELVCDESWSTLHWSFADMIAYASRGAEVRAGDLFGSGTVATGCLLEHIGVDPDSPRWLKPGDQVELEIERLGRVTTTVMAAQDAVPIPAPN